ncbi:PAS domain S-box protein [Nodularia sp. UHCC 0506]|uniref:PAS domain S-box protein n=1 Tax=Nodularia sp. UHCC 0506 TaxID=3110243 RepID=UPI002B1F92D4|nr:PAS domain S-box protein [Nodularia sp. UHCC 0506]MEA5514323.1 PAS domain S-box protein [Nodularia sp. UHCC 0506]
MTLIPGIESLANCVSLELPALRNIIYFSPVTVTSDARVIDAIALMSQARGSNQNLPTTQEKASCILVVSQGQLVGIFTEWDVVRLTAIGVDLSEITIAEVMIHPVITIQQSQAENMLTVLSILHQNRIRHLPVVDHNHHVMGVITPEAIRQVIQPANLLRLRTVSEVTVNQNIYAPLTARLFDIAELMNDQNISCVVIAEPDTLGRIIPQGIITERDIVQFQVLGLDFTQIQAQTVMSTPLFCVCSQDSLWFANQEMQRRQLRRLVVTCETGEFLGIVTQTSFLQLFDPLEMTSLIAALQQQVTAQGQELKHTNQQLQEEIIQRRQAEEKLHQAYTTSEQQVAQRIAELSQANALLQQEIEERQKTELALRKSEAQAWQQLAEIENIYASVPVGLSFMDTTLKFVRINEHLAQINNIPVADHIGRTLREVLPSLSDKLEPLYQQVIESGLPIINHKVHGTTLAQPGIERYWLVNYYPLRGHDGEMLGVNSVIQDITERQRTEEQLRYQAQIIDQIHDSVIATDIQGYITSWNQGAEKLTGYSATEAMGKHISLLYPGELGTVLENQIIAPLLKTGKHEIEVTMQNKFGKRFDALLSMSLLRSPNQTPIAMIGYSLDITERKRAETALRQSQQQFEDIINNSTAIIFLKDLQGRYILVNRGFTVLFNLSQEQIQGKTDYELFPQTQAEKLVANDRQVIEARKPLTVEELVPLADGIYTYLTVKFPLLDAEGVPYAVCGIATDITKSKQAEEKIREQAALIDIATDAIFVCNLEQRILFWNQGAEGIYEWSEAEVLGKNANQILYEKASPQLEAARLSVLKDNSWQGELKQITKHGKKIIVQSRWTLVRDKFGEPKSILIVNTDITEKKQLEAKFLRTQRLENLGILASGIAHDLNNILTPILTSTQLLPLRLHNIDEQSRQLLKMQQDSAKRGAELIKQILSFAQGVEGKHFPLQIRHLLREIEQIVKSTFPKSIAVKTYIPNTINSIIVADPTQIHQVLMNLCVNARDAMPNGGTLRLEADNFFVDEHDAQMNPEARVGSYIVITVSDTGCGIPRELLKRIFEPFFTTKEFSKGTGLGLSTIVGILKNHGGFINVESKVGLGSDFKVYLPVSEQIVTEEIYKSEIPKGNDELILIVDDEDSIRATNKATLESYNYKVITANDGIEAVSIYAQYQNKINLVLMDIEMPSMDGIRAIQVLCKINPAIKIVAMSGLLSNRDRLRHCCADHIKKIGGCVPAFLSKPYSVKELLETVQFILNNH